VAVGSSLDQAVAAESAEVVGGLSGGDGGRVQAAELGGQPAEIAVGEAVQVGPEGQQRRQQGMAAGLAKPQARDGGAGGSDDRVIDVVDLTWLTSGRYWGEVVPG